MKPIAEYGLDPTIFDDFAYDADERALVKAADPNNPGRKRLRNIVLNLRLRDAGVLLAPASGCGPAAFRILDHRACRRIVDEFDAQQAASFARLRRKLLGNS